MPVLGLQLDLLAKVAQPTGLQQRLSHPRWDRRRVERAVLVDARVDAGRASFSHGRARHRIARLARPMQRPRAELRERDRRRDAITVSGRSDEAEMDLAHYERGAILADHLIDRKADRAEEVVLGIVEPGDDPRIVDEP